MKRVIKYSKKLLMFWGLIIAFGLLTSILNLFGVSNKVTYIINSVLMIIMFFVYGIKAGKETLKKGYLAGLKIALILTINLFLINLIFFRTMSWKSVIFYIIYTISSIFGSMLGINKGN